MKADSYMFSVLWCCTSCGFVLEGGQPAMECPICDAYKTSFIDSPAHVEADIRSKHGALSNSATARAERLERLATEGYLRSFRLKGRFVETVNKQTASRSYT